MWDRSPHLLGSRLYSVVCGIPRRGAALRAAGLRPLRVAGLCPGPHPSWPSGRPQPVGTAVPARQPAAAEQGASPQDEPLIPEPRLTVSRSGSAALTRRGTSGPRPAEPLWWKGLRPGKAGVTDALGAESPSRGTRCASSEGNLSATSAHHDPFDASHRQRTAARTDEVRLPGRSPHPCRKATPVKPRCEAARPTTRQREAQRTGERPGGSRAKEHAKLPRRATNRNTRRHPFGQLPGAKRLLPSQKPTGKRTDNDKSKVTGGEAASAPQGRPRHPAKTAQPAPGGRATHRTRARSGQEVNGKKTNSMTNEKDNEPDNVKVRAKARSA